MALTCITVQGRIHIVYGQLQVICPKSLYGDETYVKEGMRLLTGVEINEINGTSD